MPLTKFQSKLAKLLATNRSEDSHLAGGAALHFQPNSIRYSQDLDYFHDSEMRVLQAFKLDQALLNKTGYRCETEMNHPGYIRALVSKGIHSTKVEWAYDSSWRFMPVIYNDEVGYLLSPVDLAINKLLALAGRDEPRDYLDVHFTHKNILELGPQCWAACGKDPGYNPLSLLELLKRRGKYRLEDFKRLELTIKIDLVELKESWLAMLDSADQFIRSAPPKDLGCLYYNSTLKKFFGPDFSKDIGGRDYQLHFGKPGGIIPSYS